WRWEQAGVNAAGTAIRTIRLPRKISSVVNSFTPSEVSCFSVTDGILSPTLMVMVSLRVCETGSLAVLASLSRRGAAGGSIAQGGSLGKQRRRTATQRRLLVHRRKRIPRIGV